LNRILEIILGLERGFLNRQGDFSLQFNPPWPGMEILGATFWNLVLIGASVAWVWIIYKREAQQRRARLILSTLRLALLLLVIGLLNRPVITLTQPRIEPSVLAIMVDDSLSMSVRDVQTTDGSFESRLQAIQNLMTRNQARLLNELSKTHQLRFYRFSGDAVALPVNQSWSGLSIEPTGQRTQVAGSILTVLRELQGLRLAGVVVLTDGRDMPQQSVASTVDAIRDFGVPVFAIPVGSDQMFRNIEIQQVSSEDTVFIRDIANIKCVIRVTGPPGQQVVVRLKDKTTGAVIRDSQGRDVETTVTPDSDEPIPVELQFTPTETGVKDLIIEAEPQPGELDDADNSRELQLTVLDSKINVLYVEGYPRWDYRYLKNELIRDKTIDVSCLLFSADPSFRQEGDKPITRFPENLQELLEYDVVLFGDVDPREFSDYQLQLVNEFVARRGGGFGMVAGPRFSPPAWRGTPIESILPVDITRTEPEEWGTTGSTIAQGFRPVVTKDAQESSLFRFFPDRNENAQFLKEAWQAIFWYTRGVKVKPGIGQVLAEHPNDLGPDGKLAPILVVGRFGAGRTLFFATDESWRWRYYTGENIFNTFWVQNLRYLARSRKIGQRKITFTVQRPVYELGQQVRLTARVIDPQLLTQLSEQIGVQILDSDAQLIAPVTLVRQPGSDTYLASFTADRIGKFSVLLKSVAPGVEEIRVPLEISLPKLELSSPQVDRPALSRFATETAGRVIEWNDAERQLLSIPSAERQIPVLSSQPIWDAPIALVVFILLLTSEWVVRKIFGMV
jgi:uncharacterized membrane protein